MKTGILSTLAGMVILLAGCSKSPDPAPRWEYKTIAVEDDYFKNGLSGNSRDKGYFSGLEITKELGENSPSTDWEMCGCFLEPRENGRLILIFKRRW